MDEGREKRQRKGRGKRISPLSQKTLMHVTDSLLLKRTLANCQKFCVGNVMAYQVVEC